MRLTQLAHEFLREHLRPGDTAIDATVGNGHDTKFLAECVGPTGRLIGFDIQEAALENARGLLKASGIENVELILADHSKMREFVMEPVSASTFNLGYLPGGEKSVITRTPTTLAATDSALSLLRVGGMLTIIGYRGHDGGREETDAVRELLKGRKMREIPASESPVSPVLFVVTI